MSKFIILNNIAQPQKLYNIYEEKSIQFLKIISWILKIKNIFRKNPESRSIKIIYTICRKTINKPIVLCYNYM